MLHGFKFETANADHSDHAVNRKMMHVVREILGGNTKGL
jgi:hypothetical protein